MLITCLAVALVWFGGISPVLEWRAEQAGQAAMRAETLTRMQALVDRLPAMQAEAEARKAGAAESRVLLAGQTDAVAAAELQQIVQRLTVDAGGRLSSVQILPAERVGNYRRIMLRVSLQAPYAAGIAILHSIAGARPAMLVDDLKLQAPPMRNAALPMDASFTVLAYRAGNPV